MSSNDVLLHRAQVAAAEATLRKALFDRVDPKDEAEHDRKHRAYERARQIAGDAAMEYVQALEFMRKPDSLDDDKTSEVEDLRRDLTLTVETLNTTRAMLASYQENDLSVDNWAELHRLRAEAVPPTGFDSWQQAAGVMRAKVVPLEKEVADLYLQRSHLVAALARSFPSGICKTEIEGWDPEWHRCCRIDLPTGQVSYHYHDSHAWIFERLPHYSKPWDGSGKEETHKRLFELKSGDEIAWIKPMLQEYRTLANGCLDLHANEVTTVRLWCDNFEMACIRHVIARERGCSPKDI